MLKQGPNSSTKSDKRNSRIPGLLHFQEEAKFIHSSLVSFILAKRVDPHEKWLPTLYSIILLELHGVTLNQL